MGKLKDLINNALVEMGIQMAEDTEVTAVEVKTIPTTLKYTVVDAEVYIVNDDGTEVILVEGEFKVTKDDKEVMLIVKDSKLVSVEDVEVKEEEPVVEAKEEEPVVKQSKEDAELKMASELREVIDNIQITKAGTYYIDLEVNSDLEVIWGSMSSYQDLTAEDNIQMEKDVKEMTKAFETKMNSEKSKYENVIEALKMGKVESPKITETKSEIKMSKRDIFRANLG